MEVLCLSRWRAYIFHEEMALAKRLGKSGSDMVNLMLLLYGKGQHLYLDNWCINKKLFVHFEQNGTVACGAAMNNLYNKTK